jgi:rhodanese-related sulfurtransferase
VYAARELVAGGALLIDVRRHEDASARLEGARRIPPDEIPSLIADLPRGTPIVLACT